MVASVTALGAVMLDSVGALLLPTVMVKVSLARRLPLSVAVTVTFKVPATVPDGGVPLKVWVEALKLSQLGSAPPPSKVAL